MFSWIPFNASINLFIDKLEGSLASRRHENSFFLLAKYEIELQTLLGIEKDESLVLVCFLFGELFNWNTSASNVAQIPPINQSSSFVMRQVMACYIAM